MGGSDIRDEDIATFPVLRRKENLPAILESFKTYKKNEKT